MTALDNVFADAKAASINNRPEVMNAIFSSENWMLHDSIDAIQQLMSPFFNVAPVDRQLHLSATMNVSMLEGMVFSDIHNQSLSNLKKTPNADYVIGNQLLNHAIDYVLRV